MIFGDGSGPVTYPPPIAGNWEVLQAALPNSLALNCAIDAKIWKASRLSGIGLPVFPAADMKPASAATTCATMSNRSFSGPAMQS